MGWGGMGDILRNPVAPDVSGWNVLPDGLRR